MNPEQLEALTSKRICCECVGEAFLSDLIAEDGVVAACAYCEEGLAPTWTIECLSDAVEAAFKDHMERTPTEPSEIDRPLYADRELNMSWYREGQETAAAIEDSALIPSGAARDVQAVLEDRYDDVERSRMGMETEFESDACYGEKRTDAIAWHWAWSNFENGITTEARFFNSQGAAMLARVFGNIDQLRTKPRYPAVVTVGPNRRINHLYRARVFQADGPLEEAMCQPDKHIGSPPPRFAHAGRMNAQGISVFYGATKCDVALAEVRPPVGSRVALARFDIIRPLRLLDLTALDHARDGGSIFDRTLKDRLERVAFLQSLGERMTQPVMPDDAALDYLTTQAIADFLGSENQPRLDGIIFASVQSKRGRNVVLFHAAARVEPMQLPTGTEVNGRSRDYADDSPNYVVWESVPEDSLTADLESDSFAGPTGVSEYGYEVRDSTLRVDPASVEVHHIDWVQVRSTSYGVSRHRVVKLPEHF